jgi:G3E family GTPase
MNRHAFLSQTADRARLPVALLSGFLGSGKTTLVNALLRDPRMANTAVAVNEFGVIPIDRDLIDHGQDKTVVMANGCLCCNLAGDMEDAVMRLFSRRQDGDLPAFERLIVEPSGLSDPAPIAQAILRNPVIARSMRLETIVTTVDALFAPAQVDRHPETRKQIALADRLVLTKSDLADPGPARDLLRGLNPAAPVLTATLGAIDPFGLFPASFFDPEAPATPRSLFLADDPDHAGGYASVSLTAGRLKWRPFEDWLRRIRIAHAEQLLRVKGILDIDGSDGPVVVQGVHHVISAPSELDAWPPGERRSRLVLIADPATIDIARRSWEDALPGMLAGG